MKLDLSDRMSSRIGWIVVAGLFAALLAAPAYYVLRLVAFVAVEQYSGWLRGYGILSCTVHTSGDTVSPSGRWTARIERSEGCDGSPDPWVDVALIPNDRPGFLARHKWVFYRNLKGQKPDSDRIAIKWISDSVLELHTTPCLPRCNRWDEKANALVPTGVNPCESDCSTDAKMGGVTISIKPAGDQ